MTTGRILVKKALQRAGIITKNEAPAADEISDGLDTLNDMIASWSNDNLLCFARTLETFPLTGASEYTIGTGQTFNTARPTMIVAATLRWQNTDYDLAIVSDDSFERFVRDKAETGLPNTLSYDNGFPVGKIRLWPSPMSGYSLRLLTEKPLSAFTLDTVLELPPGWNRAIITNLSEELKPEYGQPADAGAKATAIDALAAIKMNAARNHSLDALPTAGSYGQGNIYTGWM